MWDQNNGFYYSSHCFITWQFTIQSPWIKPSKTRYIMWFIKTAVSIIPEQENDFSWITEGLKGYYK